MVPQDPAALPRSARRRGPGGWRLRGLRGRLLLHQALVALVLVGSAGATQVMVQRIDTLAERDRAASGQLLAVTRLAGLMHRQSQALAELLLPGGGAPPALGALEAETSAALDEVLALAEREIALIRGEEERAAEIAEVARLERIHALVHARAAFAGRLADLRDQGRTEAAAELFRADAGRGASAELDRLLAEAVADEEAELEDFRAASRALKSQLLAGVLGLSLLAILITVAAGARLGRGLTRGLGALLAGTRAVGEGDLATRIPEDQPGEFADLARQFNRTAARLEAQRDELLAVQSGLEAEIARHTGRLEEANARLERLDRMRMLFLADIGHELRTPLTVLRGEAEIALRSDRPAGEHRETLLRVVQIAQQMGRLVEDLLFLARSEVGAVRFEMEPLLLQDILEVALADARVLAESRGVAIDARWTEAPLRMEGDAGRLAQAVLIVLDNAVKYSADGAPPVEVGLDREGAEAVLTVVNRGPGIPAADLPFVFSRFWRGRQEEGRPTEGSGLGLPIAKWILDSHGGRIAIESAGGRTAVTLHLPLRS